MPPAQHLAVAMAVHNGERYLRSAIESVLNQTHADFVFHVFDDGSTDSTPRILESIADPRLRVHRFAENQGLARIRQHMLTDIDAEWIAVLDADDVARPDRLAKQLAVVRSSPAIVAVGSALECIDDSGATIGYRSYPVTGSEVRRRLPIECCVANPAVLFNRARAIEAGGYEPGTDGCEDYSLWLRMALLGDIANHVEPLTRYRIHAGQFKARRTREQLLTSLRVRAQALRLGYSLTPWFAITWIGQAVLTILPARLVLWFFVNRTIEPTADPDAACIGGRTGPRDASHRAREPRGKSACS